jgi:hypothetical protein
LILYQVGIYIPEIFELNRKDHSNDDKSHKDRDDDNSAGDNEDDCKDPSNMDSEGHQHDDNDESHKDIDTAGDNEDDGKDHSNMRGEVDVYNDELDRDEVDDMSKAHCSQRLLKRHGSLPPQGLNATSQVTSVTQDSTVSMYTSSVLDEMIVDIEASK